MWRGAIPTLVTLAAAEDYCPGSAEQIHAATFLELNAKTSCAKVREEIMTRIQENEAGTWTDPHNTGHYFFQADNDYQIDVTRVTGTASLAQGGPFTDKIRFTVFDNGENCVISACSESQVPSVTDFSTHYCNIRNLICGSDQGCEHRKHDFTFEEKIVELSPARMGYPGASADPSACIVPTVLRETGDFEAFKNKYGKVYNGDEDRHRAVYEFNMKRNAEHNAQNLGFELGENQFSDLTQEQYRVAAGLGYKSPENMDGLPHLGVHEYNGEELAASVDWTTKGAVTPVKDQGQCGSCWAFSTTGSTEGAWQIGSGQLKSLSEQQLVDCATATSAGCQGGSMAGAIQYESGTAMATEASYPYKAADGTCKTSFTTAIPQGGITGYKSVGNFLFGASKTAMQSAIQQQPVSIAIEADQYAFQAYKSGILSSGCGTSLDHGVLAVGYGTENGQDYWLVKNSWGTSWGMSGYIKIGSDSNVCGVLNQPVYPQVSASLAV